MNALNTMPFMMFIYHQFLRILWWLTALQFLQQKLRPGIPGIFALPIYRFGVETAFGSNTMRKINNQSLDFKMRCEILITDGDIPVNQSWCQGALSFNLFVPELWVSLEYQISYSWCHALPRHTVAKKSPSGNLCFWFHINGWLDNHES